MAKQQSSITEIDSPADAAVVEAPPPAGVVIDQAKAEALGLSGDRVTVVIHPTDGDGGSDAVFVGLNGTGYQIPRGSPQNIPVELKHILDNAKITHLSAGREGALIERTVQRHAVSAA